MFIRKTNIQKQQLFQWCRVLKFEHLSHIHIYRWNQNRIFKEVFRSGDYLRNSCIETAIFWINCCVAVVFVKAFQSSFFIIDCSNWLSSEIIHVPNYKADIFHTLNVYYLNIDLNLMLNILYYILVLKIFIHIK